MIKYFNSKKSRLNNKVLKYNKNKKCNKRESQIIKRKNYYVINNKYQYWARRTNNMRKRY